MVKFQKHPLNIKFKYLEITKLKRRLFVNFFNCFPIISICLENFRYFYFTIGFDFTNKIAFYDSIRDFTSLEMRYLATAISTEKIRVNATPTEFKIDEDGSNQIREYVISHISQLEEISEELALNSPRYLSVLYADDTTIYFKYDEEFYKIFSIATTYKIETESSVPTEPSPYAIQREPEPSPYAMQKDNVAQKKTTYNQTTSNIVISSATVSDTVTPIS